MRCSYFLDHFKPQSIAIIYVKRRIGINRKIEYGIPHITSCQLLFSYYQCRDLNLRTTGFLTPFSGKRIDILRGRFVNSRGRVLPTDPIMHSSGFAFPRRPPHKRVVYHNGTRIRANINTGTTIPTLIWIYNYGRLAPLGIGHKYVRLAYINASIAAITKVGVEYQRPRWAGRI